MARTDQLINIYYGRTGGGRGTRPSGGLEKIRRIRGYEGGGGRWWWWWWWRREPVYICREGPGGILSGTHGKCGEAGGDWTTTTGGGGATCRAGRALESGECRVSSHQVSFSGHRAVGLNRSVMVRQ